MKNDGGPMKPVAWLWLVVATMLAMGALCPPQALAQVPARFYWKTLSDANAVPLIVNSMSGNTNPFDPAHTVTPGANFDATLAMAGYARTFSLFDRAAMAAVLLPMGRISGEVTVAGRTFNQSASGFGDPMLEFNINVIGPPAQKNIPDVLRYEPGFSVDLLADLAVPIGEYDSNQPLNIGQNRWYGRLGVPIIWQLGPWVPGRRTTLEFLPAVWFFGDNDDYVGQTLKTDPLFQLDAHLTRDFTEQLLGVARRRLVLRRQGDHQRRRGREAQQPRRRTHARLPDQRQPEPHRSATSRPSTTALPTTFAWTGSWSRSCTGGTRSSKACDG
ncbi:MAG: transporter [Desulfobacterales bacterium]|nr:transporter [Desulfobacterales bacterium]